MKQKITGKHLLAMALFSGLLTFPASLNLINRADWLVSDLLNQRQMTTGDQIVVIGIDQESLETLGPYSQWSRDIFAQAIEALNQSDECRPAVIAIDILFAGETQKEPDLHLTEAAGKYGNVITACAMEFQDTFIQGEGDSFHWERFHASSFDEPYEALKNATRQGHINAMMDSDGILRRHLLYARLPDGREIPSLSLAAARMYQEYYGLSEQKLPRLNQNGFWYLPFTALPGDFGGTFSVADLLSDDFSPEYFAGKIVLIGPYAPGLQDSYRTAIDHAAPMYGVEYQANAIHALLRGDTKQK